MRFKKGIWRAGRAFECSTRQLYCSPFVLGDFSNSSANWVACRVDFAVLRRMAAIAKGDQVIFVVRTRVATEALVMDFEVGHGSAELTTPAVAPQHLFA